MLKIVEAHQALALEASDRIRQVVKVSKCPSRRMQVDPRVFLCTSAIAATACLPVRGASTSIQFNRDVRPILSENCYACHGPDKNQRKGKLRLDIREVALEREAFVPGKPDESKLVQHIFATDPDDLMPPVKSGKKLTQKQKEILKNWIAAGAEYEPHWAYIEPQRPALPAVKNIRWIKNPIDCFILHGLDSRNIKPSMEADKRTLLRRVSLDLIGLPPTPAEAAAFLGDSHLDAYERVVDRLLASPHFGERMAVPWLDVVRYADTVGYHGDQNQNIFPYRDYVINAFNQNMPFDQFTVEQLAGDLLTDPSIDDYVASGFNRLNMITREGGAQPKEYLAKYAADRVRTVSMAWLGSTMGCAECHDHKYDPFSTKDFYQMEAFFADIKQWGYYADAKYSPNPDLPGYGNEHPFPPEIQVNSEYLQHRLAKLERQSMELYRSSAAQINSVKFDAWCNESIAFLKRAPSGWVTPIPMVVLKFKETNVVASTNFSIRQNGTIEFSEAAKENTTTTLELSPMWIGAIRLEIVPQTVRDAKRASMKKRSGTAISVSATLKASDGKATKLPFYFGDADYKEDRYAMTQPIIGVTDTWQISTNHDLQTAVWLLKEPVKAGEGDKLILSLGNAAVATARVSVTPFPAVDPLESGLGEALRKALAKSVRRRTVEDSDLLERTFLLGTGWTGDALARARKLQGEIRECRGGRAATMITVAREPMVIRVLARGNWQDENGEIVQPAVPHFLPQISNSDGRRLTRLDLARWLVSPQNPLTARAVMNRLWKQFFGAGISAVVDDLGAQGEWPIHPELLDWLASEFMRPECYPPNSPPSPAHNWDIKHMVRLMVTCATYRQNSNQRPDLKEIDPNNRLLACQSPRRLEAEFVRDNALFIAGILNEDFGGPPAHPYQPAGYYANLQFPDRDYYPDLDQRQYRRGVYAHWQRTFLQPMLANFDAPSREECTANRVISNTPQQALTLLNDPTFVEAARVFAARILASSSLSDDQRIDLAFEIALARPATPKETNSLVNFLAEQRRCYDPNSDEASKLLRVGIAPTPKNNKPAELAAWAQVCRVILNLHETITRY